MLIPCNNMKNSSIIMLHDCHEMCQCGHAILVDVQTIMIPGFIGQ